MRHIYMLAIAAALPGCAQLLGIDDTKGGGVGSLDLAHVSVGATVTSQPQPLTAPPSFIIEDASGSRGVEGMPGKDGHWSSPQIGAEQVVYTGPDVPTPFQHAISLASPQVLANVILYEHPNPQPAPAATVAINVGLPSALAAGEAFQVFAIGAWTQHAFVAAELPAVGGTAIAATVPYASFVAMSASPAARINSTDVVAVVRYTNGDFSGAFLAPAFDQSDAGDTLTGNMTAFPADTAVNGTIDPATVATRFTMLQPATAAPGSSWRIDASPGYAVGANLGVPILARGIAATDTTISAMFANPFVTTPGWHSVLSYGASSSRSFTLGGATIGLSASLSMVVEPGAGLALDMPAGLPTMISLGGMPLTTDGMTVTLDATQPAPIDIVTDKVCTWYRALLVEYTVVTGSPTTTPVIDTAGPSPSLTLPANVLIAGHTYALSVTCIKGGLTGVSSGDLQAFSLPIAVGQATSGVFTLSP